MQYKRQQPGSTGTTYYIRISDVARIAVDADDYPFLSGLRWKLKKSHNVWYAVTSVTVAGRKKQIKMHRLITGAQEPLEVHHIDHNALNNTRANLLVCSKEQHLFFHNRFMRKV